MTKPNLSAFWTGNLQDAIRMADAKATETGLPIFVNAKPSAAFHRGYKYQLQYTDRTREGQKIVHAAK